MPKWIELKLKSYGDPSSLLIPISAITTLKEMSDGQSIVFIKDLKLYAENYYKEQQYKFTPDYIDIEAIEVDNDYNALKFLIQAGSKDD